MKIIDGVRLLLLAVALSGCATARIGMTLDEFKSACRSASWADAEVVQLSSGSAVAVCSVTGVIADPQYQVFEDGVLKRLVPEDEVLAMLEHDRCVGFGAVLGTEPYTNCRISLAQLRAESQLSAQMQRQQAAVALLQYSATLQQMSQPVTVRLQANCTARQVGSYTTYTCL